MNIEVKNSVKPIDYIESMKVLEQRVHDVFLGRKNELLWIIEHKPVYTAGISSKRIDLLDKKINVIKTQLPGILTFLEIIEIMVLDDTEILDANEFVYSRICFCCCQATYQNCFGR